MADEDMYGESDHLSVETFGWYASITDQREGFVIRIEKCDSSKKRSRL